MFDNFIKWFWKKNKETEGGLAGGLAGGLVFGLAGGLVFGLAGGLVFGLAGGLACGFGTILSLNIASTIKFPPEITWLLFGVFILTEILFWIEKAKPQKKENKLWFTIKRKTINAIIVTFGFVQAYGFIVNLGKTTKWIETNYGPINEFLATASTWIFWGIIIIGCLIAYFWLNSLKYKKGGD